MVIDPRVSATQPMSSVTRTRVMREPRLDGIVFALGGLFFIFIGLVVATSFSPSHIGAWKFALGIASAGLLGVYALINALDSLTRRVSIVGDTLVVDRPLRAPRSVDLKLLATARIIGRGRALVLTTLTGNEFTVERFGSLSVDDQAALVDEIGRRAPNVPVEGWVLR